MFNYSCDAFAPLITFFFFFLLFCVCFLANKTDSDDIGFCFVDCNPFAEFRSGLVSFSWSPQLQSWKSISLGKGCLRHIATVTSEPSSAQRDIGSVRPPTPSMFEKLHSPQRVFMHLLNGTLCIVPVPGGG